MFFMKNERVRYNIWKWIITAGLAVIVFFAGWLAGDLFDLIKGKIDADFEYISDLEPGLQEELKDYDINLPKTAEAVMGYRSVNTMDPYLCMMFTVNDEDFAGVFGDMWEKVQGEHLENTDVLADWFGRCAYNDIMSNSQWEFVGAMANYPLNGRIFYSEPIDGRRAVAFVRTG